MAWFGDALGDGLSKVKGQITKFTNDVLSEDPLAASSFEGRIKELEEKNSSLQFEIDRLLAENNNLKSGKGFELSDYQIQSICELESKIYELTSEKEQLTKALEEIETEHQKELEVIIKDRDKLKVHSSANIKNVNEAANIQKLEDDLRALQLQNDILYEDGKNKDEELQKSISEGEKLKSQITSLKLQMEQSNDKMNSITGLEYDYNEKIKSLESREEDLTTTITNLESKINILKDELNLERQKSQDILKELDEKNSDIANRDDVIEQLETYIKSNEKLQESLSLTESEYSELFSQFCSLKEDNDRLKDEEILAKVLENKLKIADTEIQELPQEKKKVEELSSSQSEVDQELSNLKEYAKKLREKKEELTLRLRGTVDENATIVEILTQEKRDLQEALKKASVDDVEKQIHELKLKHANEIIKLKNDNKAMKGDCTKIRKEYENKLENLQKDLEVVQSELVETSNTADGLKRKVLEQQGVIELLNKQLSDSSNAENDLKMIRGENINLKAVITKLQNEVSEVSDLKSQVVEQQNRIKVLSKQLSKVNSLENELVILKEENNELKSEIEKLHKEKVDTADREKQILESLQRENYDLRAEILSYQTGNHLLEDEFNRLAEFKRKFKDEYDQIRLQVSDSEEASNEVNALKRNILEKQDNIEELNKQLSDFNEIRNRMDLITKENEILKEEKNDLMIKLQEMTVEKFENKSSEEIQDISELEDLKKENSELKCRVEENLQENEVLRGKLEKLEVLVARTEERENLVSGTLSLQLRKLKLLVGRIKREFLRSTRDGMQVESDSCEDEEAAENVMTESQTDDIKSLQQDVSKMTEVIKMIDQGLTTIYEDRSRLQKELAIVQSLAGKTEQELTIATKAKQQLETNIQEWAAAVASRDEIIQHLSNTHNSLENDYVLLKREIEGVEGKLEKSLAENKELGEKMREMESASLEWNKRLEELQKLYQNESQRCEELRKRKDEEIASLNRRIASGNGGDTIDNTEGSSDAQVSDLRDQVARLLDENTDLKMLIQQLRENIIAMNTRLPEVSSEQTQHRRSHSHTDGHQADLLTEQQKYQALLSEHKALIENESSLRRELDRLRAHMVEVEENYTEEAVVAKTELAELRAKLATVEEQLHKSTSVHKSANVRSTQHVEALQVQVQLMAEQRNDLQIKLSDAEDHAQKQAAALASLQLVLEQFQLDKQRELKQLEERLTYQIELEKRRGQELQNEIENLNQQLLETKNGLKAARRLGEQLEKKTMKIVELEQELAQASNKLEALENNLKIVNQSSSGKIDKFLVKNLFVGYLSANGEQKNQALKILTSVLELSAEERARAGVENQGGWLSSLLHPSPNSGGPPPSESLSQAFVRFLESESKPQPQLKLLTETPKSSQGSFKRTPLVLSDLVLPPVTPTQVSDNSLSDMLKDS